MASTSTTAADRPLTISAKEIALRLGGEAFGNSATVPGPGHSRSDRSLSVKIADGAPEGFFVYSHAGDDWRVCRDWVRFGLGLNRQQVRVVDAFTRTPSWHAGRERREQARAIWLQAGPINETPAEAYLTKRGLSYNGEALRWHPACPFGRQRAGCLVALVRNIATNEPQAIHRTAIDPSGNKRSQLGSGGRLCLGTISGGAVKLTDDSAVAGVVAIGEGIETTLSLRHIPSLDAIPIWSVLNANGLAAFPVLAGIESVWIAADNDLSGTGQRVAMAAAMRLSAANIEAIVLAPARAGSDLNDRVKRG